MPREVRLVSKRENDSKSAKFRKKFQFRMRISADQRRWAAVLTALILLGALLIGCASQKQNPVEEPAAGGESGGAVASAALNETGAGSQNLLEIKTAQQDEEIGVDFRGVLSSGFLHLEILSENGETIWDEPIADPGPFVINTLVTVPEPGAYDLLLSWEGPVQATYSLRWAPGRIETPEVKPFALLGGIGMILAALAFLILAVQRRLGWGYLLLGALAWVITVALKLGWAALMNGRIYNALTSAFSQGVADLMFSLYVGLLTGVFEVGLVWLVLRFTRLGQVNWKRALGFGIGFGAIEALLLGINSLGSVLTGIISPDSLPLGALEAIARQSSLLWGLAPIWERFFTILIHIFTSLLLFYSVRTGQSRWFWAAFLYKTLLDTIAAYAQVRGLDSIGLVWGIELVVGLFGGLGLWGIFRLKSVYPELPVGISEAPTVPPDDPV